VAISQWSSSEKARRHLPGVGFAPFSSAREVKEEQRKEDALLMSSGSSDFRQSEKDLTPDKTPQMA
jgi:hypothetical protein